MFIAKVSANNAEYIYIFHVHHGLWVHIEYVDSLSIYTVLVAIDRRCAFHICVSVTDVSVMLHDLLSMENNLLLHCGTRSFAVHGCVSIAAEGIVCYTWNGSQGMV